MLWQNYLIIHINTFLLIFLSCSVLMTQNIRKPSNIMLSSLYAFSLLVEHYIVYKILCDWCVYDQRILDVRRNSAMAVLLVQCVHWLVMRLCQITQSCVVQTVNDGYSLNVRQWVFSPFLQRCTSYRKSVCLSVCLSQSGTVSKRLKLGSWDLHWRIAPWV